MKRYLVTGATGFLGRHVVAALRARGDVVVAVARGHEGRGKGAKAPTSLADLGALVVKADVLDQAALKQAAEGCDGVFHCAGLVSRDPDDAEKLFSVNVVGTRNVIAAAREAKVPRVVVASTSGTVAISEEPEPIPNEDSPTPLHLIQRFPYYRAKLFAEQEALGANGDGLAVMCVNPSILFGPGDVFGSSTGDIRLFLDRAIPAVPSGGISFVDARDAAQVMLRALDLGQGGRRYLVGAANMTMRDFFAKLSRVSGVAAPVLPMPASPKLARAATSFVSRLLEPLGAALPVDPVSVEMGQLFWYLDSSRAERELGFAPRDPVETLAETVRDLRGLRPQGAGCCRWCSRGAPAARRFTPGSRRRWPRAGWRRGWWAGRRRGRSARPCGRRGSPQRCPRAGWPWAAGRSCRCAERCTTAPCST